MRCPLDVEVELVMTERQGVEIDYCPTCRGVWLDRGELDKILDRAAGPSPVPPPPTGHAAGHVSGEGGHGVAAEPLPGYAGPGRGYPADRSGAGGSTTAGYGVRGPEWDDDRRDDDRRDADRYDDRPGRPGHDPRRRRKDSWLGDLLDF